MHIKGKKVDEHKLLVLGWNRHGLMFKKLFRGIRGVYKVVLSTPQNVLRYIRYYTPAGEVSRLPYYLEKQLMDELREVTK